MKKIILIASILLLAAGCVKEQPAQVINYPTPTPTPVVTPTPVTNDWQTYNYLPNNFTFNYPKDFGFTQVSTVFLSERIVQLEPLENKYPNTNYVGSSFAIGTGFAKTAAECLVSQSNGKSLMSNAPVVVNGLGFYKDQSNGVGAGNIYNSTIYRAWQNSLCVEMVLTIHTGNIANYPTESKVAEVDQTKPMAVLEQIMQTVKFTK